MARVIRRFRSVHNVVWLLIWITVSKFHPHSISGIIAFQKSITTRLPVARSRYTNGTRSCDTTIHQPFRDFALRDGMCRQKQNGIPYFRFISTMDLLVHHWNILVFLVLMPCWAGSTILTANGISRILQPSSGHQLLMGLLKHGLMGWMTTTRVSLCIRQAGRMRLVWDALWIRWRNSKIWIWTLITQMPLRCNTD